MVRYKSITFLLAALFVASIHLSETGQVYAQSKKKPLLLQETRRDPFSLPPGVHLLSGEVPVQESKKVAVSVTPEIKPVDPPLTLKAVLITDHVRLASIDRSIVTVGDFVNGEKVLEIRSDRVILEKESKKRTILLDQSPVKITVEGK